MTEETNEALPNMPMIQPHAEEKTGRVKFAMTTRKGRRVVVIGASSKYLTCVREAIGYERSGIIYASEMKTGMEMFKLVEELKKTAMRRLIISEDETLHWKIEAVEIV